jgi:predicted metalloprotease with PDZ domain
VIAEVFPGSPAAAAGVERGDRIITIDGVDPIDLRCRPLDELLDPHVPVVLVVERGEERHTFVLHPYEALP